MANPQIENGYTKIANELLEEIIKRDFSKRELKVIFSVIRFTYGFNRKEAELSIRYLEKTTGLKFTNISTTLNELENKKVINFFSSGKHSQSREISLNKNYEQWELNRSQNDNSSRLNCYQNNNGTVPKTITETVPKTITNKERYKERINKDIDQTKTLIDTQFEKFWNLYDKKVSKEKSLKLFKKLSKNEIENLFNSLPEYINSTPDKTFRKNPDTYLRNKSWNDEIISSGKTNNKSNQTINLRYVHE